MPTEPNCSRRNQRPERRYPLAGFEVIIIGRFWVITEGQRLFAQFSLMHWRKQVGFKTTYL